MVDLSTESLGMKVKYCGMSAICISSISYSQQPIFEWAKKIGAFVIGTVSNPHKEKIAKISFSDQKTSNDLSQSSFVTEFLQSIRTKMYGNK